MRIRLTRSLLLDGEHAEKGSVHSVPKLFAQDLIVQDSAVPVRGVVAFLRSAWLLCCGHADGGSEPSAAAPNTSSERTQVIPYEAVFGDSSAHPEPDRRAATGAGVSVQWPVRRPVRPPTRTRASHMLGSFWVCR